MEKGHGFHWPQGWHGLNEAEARSLKSEVFREINGMHELADHPFEVIGRCDTGDDLVLSVANWQAPFATLHLDWPKERGTLARMFGAIPNRTSPRLCPVERLTDLQRPAH